MKEERFDIWTIAYLTDSLNENERLEFEKFLKDNPEYQEKFNGFSETWSEVDNLEVPETSAIMDERFYDMLHGEIKRSETTNNNSRSWIAYFLERLWKPQVAYGILLLCIGLGFGYFLNFNSTSNPKETTIVANPETEEVRERLVLTLLEQPSANQRLQGISEANKITKVDEKVIKALLETLNGDANVNVRLAAIESLTNYIDKPVVREGLVQSIVNQDSPIVQITLADLMVALQEKKSIAPFKTLMRSNELNASVKQKLETSIKSII
ncbi:HEAT repeat domain-containing protein [Maribacter aestuarii]|uniref:HEAT repeat domain-containing protein n=1 Tax=Maribacter aestuarii TaxID=1130723 RepID=UPI00248C8CBD|nr:HEAT repeat domain-containing protein [Maribacter aestuarii]